MPVNNQQYPAEIGVFYNKLCVTVCYFSLLDFNKSYSATIFDFGGLLMVLVLLASFYFESVAYYVIIILQYIVKFNILTGSYIFQVFQLHIYFGPLQVL